MTQPTQAPLEASFKPSTQAQDITELLEMILKNLVVQNSDAVVVRDAEREDKLLKMIRSFGHSEQFYHRRVHLLERVQSRMRDPERALVCDIIANGMLLYNGRGELHEARYGVPAAPAHAEQAKPGEVSQEVMALTEQVASLKRALEVAEAALADIGDADREPGDDVAWCEARAAEALPAVRAALKTADDTLPPGFQARMTEWLLACFGEEISNDKAERNHRFLEESLELAQACECPRGEAHQLVDYVYDRPVGEKHQEVGGVYTTLAALCRAQSLDMVQCGEIELSRVWTKVAQIRAKQAAKPKGSPLPQ